MTMWTSSGMQNSTQEIVLYVGCGQLITSIMIYTVRHHFTLRSLCSFGGLWAWDWHRFDWQNLSPFGNIPMPTVHTHWFIRWEPGWDAVFQEVESQEEFWSESCRGQNGERKARRGSLQICSLYLYSCHGSFLLEEALLGGISGNLNSLVFPMSLFLNTCCFQLAKGDFLLCSYGVWLVHFPLSLLSA